MRSWRLTRTYASDYIDVSPSGNELLVSLADNTACAVSINGPSTEVGVKLNLNAINAGVPGVHGGIYINQGSSMLYGDTRERMFKWGLNGVVGAELMKGTFSKDRWGQSRWADRPMQQSGYRISTESRLSR